MKNKFFFNLKSTVKLRIEGKNNERFLRYLIKDKIEILELKNIDVHTIEIKVFKEDYEKIKEIRTLSQILLVDEYGMLKIKKILSKNSFLILFLILGYAFLIFLGSFVFDIEVVHNDKEIRDLLIKEFSNYKIEKGKFKKSFNELSKIKEEILDKYKDKLEWIEIEESGTKYIVRVEERKLNPIKEDSPNQNIVAKKSAIIRKVIANSGTIIRNVNDYVKPGDVIISGEVTLNDNVLGITHADGEVYGEVWYETTVEYPYNYREEKETGKKKTVYQINFLNYTWDLFNFKKFKNKKEDKEILLKNSIIPLSFVKNKQREINLIDEVYTEEEAVERALKLGREKMNSQLDDNEYILSEKTLKINLKDSKIEVEVFYVVYENITDIAPITLEEEEGSE